jgi:cytochrome b pre-mRNA-processing protein 3
MSIARLFAGRTALTAGRQLYLQAVEQARTPLFYRHWGVPDTADGRYELYSLHVILLLHRLKNEGSVAQETGQGLFDAYVKSLDDAMREAGVGDLSVGRKIRNLGAAFMGRIKGYDAAFAALPDTGELRSLIARTTYEATRRRRRADRLRAGARRLAVRTGRPCSRRRGWPEVGDGWSVMGRSALTRAVSGVSRRAPSGRSTRNLSRARSRAGRAALPAEVACRG